MKINTLENSTQPVPSDESGKAPYAKPVLRTFGSVRHLTRANSGSAVDQNARNSGNQGNVPF
jgi:hypothetical protein